MPNNLNTTTLPASEGIAFPHLTARDLEQLRPFGTPCSYEDGQLIFSAAENAVDLFIIESGAMEILNPAQDNRSVVMHGPTGLEPLRSAAVGAVNQPYSSPS
jgi:CRP-like cAMP-binding protein